MVCISCFRRARVGAYVVLVVLSALNCLQFVATAIILETHRRYSYRYFKSHIFNPIVLEIHNMNPLKSITGTIVAGFVIAIVLVFIFSA